jgi:hypothetical protein
VLPLLCAAAALPQPALPALQLRLQLRLQLPRFLREMTINGSLFPGGFMFDLAGVKIQE